MPEEARREVGYQLEHVQEGVDPDDWKPMSTVGSGYAKFAFGNRQELSAAFTWRRGRRELMSCTVSKEDAED
jgi:phage-related protein